MKPEVLLLSPILIPAIQEQLTALYTVHRHFEQSDPQAWLRAHGHRIRGVVTGGHAGIREEVMALLPALQVVAVNGVGTAPTSLAINSPGDLTLTYNLGTCSLVRAPILCAARSRVSLLCARASCKGTARGGV